MWKHFLSFIFPDPSMCVCCERPMDTLGLCDECRARWEEFACLEGQCKRCGIYGSRAESCDTCREWPRYYKGNHAFLPYTGEVREAIVRFKYHNEPWRVRGFEEWIRAQTPIAADAVVPVPLHKTRIRERGYNQSLLLSEVICRAWGLALHPELLERTVNTPHQASLSKTARLRNVEHAFSVPEKSRHIIEGKRILLVDDVITTGSTLTSCARALHQAGAKEIVSVTLASGIR